jgi:hypothetical protein
MQGRGFSMFGSSRTFGAPVGNSAAAESGDDAPREEDATLAEDAESTTIRGAGPVAAFTPDQFKELLTMIAASAATHKATAATESVPDVQMLTALRSFVAESPIAVQKRLVAEIVQNLRDQLADDDLTRAHAVLLQVLDGRFDAVNGITLVHRWFSPVADLQVWLDAITELPFRDALRVHNALVYPGIRKTFRLGADAVPFLLLPLFPAKALQFPEALQWNRDVMSAASAIQLAMINDKKDAAISGAGLGAESAIASRNLFAALVHQQSVPMQLEGAGHKAATPMTMEEAEHAAKHAQTPEALRALVARLVADKRSGRAPRAGGFGPKDGKTTQQAAPKTDKSGN